ncbi:MAG: D-2-hydroxyacid dehydrogenase [Tenericutes bacterium HGW-Tenericutes-5]|jgi:phosphoglycerate dehydrogenase-like enzyme|nr:MAG: D-2-hydroxyacid dehydrogenase [Tenericutes bacterium HGW-Tenericutes-5]
MKVYIDKKMMGRNNYPELLKRFPNIEFIEELDKAFDVEAMIIMNSSLKNVNVDNYPNLKWIQLLMAGFDNVNVDYIKSKNIMIGNARDIFSISIAEDVFSKILYFNRNTKFYLQSMASKTWNPIKKEPEIFNSVISILGTGSIGQEVAKRMKAFGVKKVLGYKQKVSVVPYFDEIYTGSSGLEYVIKNADYLILALPLNKNTYNLINEKSFDLMKENAVLINVARGDIIDQEALIKALKQKKIRGAGLDVTTPEPLPETNELWTLDNVFITPHNASSSPYMKDRLYQMTVENLEAYLSGKKPKYLL